MYLASAIMHHIDALLWTVCAVMAYALQVEMETAFYPIKKGWHSGMESA